MIPGMSNDITIQYMYCTQERRLIFKVAGEENLTESSKFMNQHEPINDCTLGLSLKSYINYTNCIKIISIIFG